MTRLRQLRWQLVAAQLLVVVVGVTVLAVTADATGARLVADDLRPLAAAALAAAAVGLTTSVLLLRQILRPLDEIARSSERIAAGRYDERVAVPASDELAAVAESFNQMAAALEAVEARRIALIGNVAHELRTPLAGLEGYLEGLLDGVFTADPATLHELQHEVRRLHRLVDDLQTLSNVEAGQIHLSPTDFDLVALARRVAAQLVAQTPAGSVTIDVAADASPVVVHADADRVAQIVLNLVGNAVRYTSEGGRVTIRVRREAADPASTARLDVIDTGIGIAAADLPHLFERFYRVDRSRARASGGSGIGLTVSRHLAWAMGGDITAASAGIGRGSTFSVTLPVGRS
ncbi:MAG: HAMP domain-containing protein [Ardenticatenales bacterium]|nr:HAMP domain-containing protein [Ardenticatenales bacterium]